MPPFVIDAFLVVYQTDDYDTVGEELDNGGVTDDNGTGNVVGGRCFEKLISPALFVERLLCVCCAVVGKPGLREDGILAAAICAVVCVGCP